MAFNRVFLEHPRTGQRRELPVGFSWTCFLFGVCPLIARGAWRRLFIILLLSIITVGIAFLVMPFFINKWFIEDAVNAGFAVRAVSKGTVEEVEAYLGMKLPRL